MIVLKAATMFCTYWIPKAMWKANSPAQNGPSDASKKYRPILVNAPNVPVCSFPYVKYRIEQITPKSTSRALMRPSVLVPGARPVIVSEICPSI